jgi:uncharacterized protein (TIGR03086 family)
MSAIDVLPEACSTITAVVQTAADADLGQPTPCRDWDLRALVDHFAGTTGAMARLADRQPLDPDNPWGSSTSATAGDWAATLVDHLQSMSTGWSRPEAWQGDVQVGDNAMPADMIGKMALIEVMLHGSDLAHATGQPVPVSDELGRQLRAAIDETVELGRQMGAYGAEMQVAPDAPDFDRALGAAGRDPNWRP